MSNENNTALAVTELDQALIDLETAIAYDTSVSETKRVLASVSHIRSATVNIVFPLCYESEKFLGIPMDGCAEGMFFIKKSAIISHRVRNDNKAVYVTVSKAYALRRKWVRM